MPKPTVAPDWATASTFSSGPIIGQPNKQTPSGGLVSEGWDPEQAPAAEHLNYMLNNHAAWFAWEERVRYMRRWQETFQWNVSTSSNLNPVPNYASIQVGVSGSGSTVVSHGANSISGYNSPVVELSPGGASSRYSRINSVNSLYYGANTSSAIFFEVDTAITDVSGATAGSYYAGLSDGSFSLTGATFAGLYSPIASGTWKLLTAAGTFTIPGSAPSALTMQRWRVEFYPSGTPEGIANGSGFAVVTLNGTVVLTQNGNHFTGGNLYYALEEAIATDASGGDCYMGPWQFWWDA